MGLRFSYHRNQFRANARISVKKLAILGSALGLIAAQAVGQDAVTIGDVRCVVIGMQIAGTAPPAEQSTGIFMTLYYLGRLDGRRTKADVEKLIIAQASMMTGADYAAETMRCEAGLTEKGRQIAKIGAGLTQHGKSN
jgi:hypothetical protein